MRIIYDTDTDALTLVVTSESVERTVDVGEGRFIDLDDDGRTVAIEVLDVSHGFQLHDLTDRFDLKPVTEAESMGIVKVTVNLPEDLAAQLKALAEREGKTFTQALKEAISLKLFVADALRQGAKLLIEYRDKTVERIVFH